MSTPHVSLAKQMRRIERRRRERHAALIASMNLAKQMELACDLWMIKRALNARKEIN